MVHGREYVLNLVFDCVEDSAWLELKNPEKEKMELAYYSGPVILGDFEIIRILVFFNLTKP
jgi:hypothetical protein